MLINYSGLYILQSFITMYELVAANISVKAATNISILIPFAGSLGQIGAGILVKFIKRYKWIVVSGYALIVLGMGLSYRYIDGHGQMAKLVVSQIILGLGQGMVMTTQFGMQAAVRDSGKVYLPFETVSGLRSLAFFLLDMASVTAMYTASVAVGNAIGAAVAGGMWTSKGYLFTFLQ